MYLELFTLPGESQQVDRILQAFSDKYYCDNNAMFNSTDIGKVNFYI